MSVQKQIALPHALRCAVGPDFPWSLTVSAQRATPFTSQVQVQRSLPWHRQVAAALRHPLHTTQAAALASPWSLMERVTRQAEHPYAPSWNRARSCRLPWALLTRNPCGRPLSSPWELSPAPALLQPQVALTLLAPTGPMALLAAEVGCSETDGLWQARLTLAHHADFLALRLGDPLELLLGGESFVLRVVERQGTRPAPGRVALQIRAASPAVEHDAPLAPLLDRSWEEETLARNAAQEALGNTSITWNMVDWPLRAGRLEARRISPWRCARALAEAAGGVLESLANGSVQARRRFPVALAAWSTAEPDHLFSDHADHLELRETLEESPCWKQITVRDLTEQASTRFLDIALDPRPDGLNGGVKRFRAGETAHLLVSAGPGVTAGAPVTSAGTLHDEAPQPMTFVEDAAFSGTRRSALSRPALALTQVVWLGQNLGTLSLEPDAHHLRAETPGVAVARITYTAQVQAYGLQAPTTWNDSRPYPVCVGVSASDPAGEGLRITVRRSDGTHTAPEIAAPTLSDPRALRQRGETELDASRLARRLEITALHRSGLQPGQLLEIHDALHGASFRGQLHQVQHAVQEGKALSRLIVLAPR